MFSASMQASKDMNRTFTTANLELTGNNLERILEQVDTSVQLAFSQKGVLAATQEDWASNLSAYETLLHALKVAIVSNDMICHMSLCSDTDGVLFTQNNGILPYNDTASCRAYFDSLETGVEVNGQHWYFLQRHPFLSKEYALANVRDITPLNSNEKDILLVTTLSETELANTYMFLGKESYIMTAEGRIVSAVNKSLIGTTAEKAVQNAVSKTDKQVAFLYQDQEVSVYSLYLHTLGCYLVVNTPTTVLTTTRIMMAVIAFTVIVFGLIFSLIWSNYISRTMTGPLKRLRTVMEEAHNGNLEVRCQPEQHDEIGYLCESFNHMMDSLNTYIEQLNEQQTLAKETEIRLLQSQINPHLLYNTLDSALFLMSHNATQQSIQILEQLSQYFKLSLQRGNKIVTIDVALQHIEAYINLQNLCRMKSFHLRVTGDKSLRQATILHMLMQPIVENSVLHGFDGSFADGSIEIELKKADNQDRIIIRITDDGMGMDDNELEALQTRLRSPVPDGKSFGMWNVAQRIRMCYGSDYSVQVDSEFGEYTTVTLEIPFRYGEEMSHV